MQFEFGGARAPDATLAADRFEARLRAICGLFDVEAKPRRDTISGHVSLRRISRFEVAEVRLDAQRVSRGAALIRRDQGGHFFVILQLEGRCVIEQGGLVSRLSPGSLCVVDAAVPSEFSYDGPYSRQLSFHLPRGEMIERFGPAFAAWRHLPGAQAWFAPLFALAGRLVAVKDGAARRHLEESFLSLIGAAILELDRGDPVAAAGDGALIDRAAQIIADNCADPDFTPACAAAALGVSPRTLQRRFRSLGETPSRRLIDERLKQARAKLADGGAELAEKSVAEIAYDVGFSDLSHFYRAFRRKYGAAPGELRARS